MTEPYFETKHDPVKATMPIKSIIVEDEPLSRAFLQNLLTEFCPEIILLDKAATPEEAVASIRLHQPDLVFMDIELQSGTGFDVLRELENPQFKILFTTAFDHHMIRAIRCSGLDYLLKPIDLDGLQAAINCIRGKIERNEQQQGLPHLLKTIRNGNIPLELCMNTSAVNDFIAISDITRIEADGNGSRVVMRSGKVKTSPRNLKEYEYLLSDHHFFRPHSMYIVNIKEIDRIIDAEDGYLIMSDGTQVPVSPKKRNEMPGLVNKS